MKKQFGTLNWLGYIFAIIITFGAVWFAKIVIQKALMDAQN